MRQALIVDIQSTAPENFPLGDRKRYLQTLIETGAPALIALTLYQRGKWRDLEEDIGKVVSREGSGLLLEGLIHVCRSRNHHIRDPHHEYICTSFFQRPAASYLQWVEEMWLGVSLLQHALGVRPVGYLPPQHLWNEYAVGAVAANKMNYLITNAVQPQLFPYKDGNVIIVPSGSVKKGHTDNPVVHVYYDWIQKTRAFENLSDIVPISEIPVGDKTSRHDVNEMFLRGAKQFRDLKRLINFIFRKQVYPYADDIREKRLAELADQWMGKSVC